MTLQTTEQAEDRAARHWCAGLLAGMGSNFQDDAAKRYIDRAVYILIGGETGYELEDVDQSTELTEDEKDTLCHHVETFNHDGIEECTVRGQKYITCEGCPYDIWGGVD